MKPLVDPFIPVSRKQNDIKGQYGLQYLEKVNKYKRDSSISRQPLERPVQAVNKGPIEPHQFRLRSMKSEPTYVPSGNSTIYIPKPSAPNSPKYQKSSIKYLKLFCLLFGIIAIGLIIQSLIMGLLVIGAYAVATFTKRIPSNKSYFLALLAFVCVVISLLTVQGESIKSDNYTVYAYLLLIIGTISLGFELQG